jgi:radical SAM protein with 4Fe4S-binding SPASM domain
VDRDLPLFERLQIESQANCNRACWFCPRTYDRTGAYLDAAGRRVWNRMPTEKILDLLDQAVAMGFGGRVGFHHYSEPLLDERNVTLAREARARGLEPYLHTNGDVLARNEALCAAVADVYEQVVVGLYDYETDEELEEAKRWWRARLAGARALEFSAIGLSGASSMGIPRALVPTDERMSVPDLTFTGAPCHRPMIRMVIRHDGEMLNCCEDTHGAWGLGNVHERPLAELWYSERHASVIRDLVAGRRDKYPLCRQCPLAPTGPAPAGERIAISVRRYDGKSETFKTVDARSGTMSPWNSA